MKKQSLALLFYLAGSLTLTGCNRLGSLTTVQAGKQFELGGNQNGTFTARLRNVGEVPITISERLADGQLVTLGTFQPGEKQTVRFPSGSAALVSNPSATSVQVHIVVTGDKNLNMRERSK